VQIAQRDLPAIISNVEVCCFVHSSGGRRRGTGGRRDPYKKIAALSILHFESAAVSRRKVLPNTLARPTIQAR
jgi:hypothetical protein